jgi:hypothetical protein
MQRLSCVHFVIVCCFSPALEWPGPLSYSPLAVVDRLNLLTFTFEQIYRQHIDSLTHAPFTYPKSESPEFPEARLSLDSSISPSDLNDPNYNTPPLPQQV